jgi:DNA-binding IclR family transcriptional regulator
MPASPRSDAAARQNGVQVISRAAEILRVLHDSPEGLTLAEVARRVGLPRSTVHRIVGTLELEGFVAGGRADARLRLGPELGRLAATSRTKLLQVTRPFMEQLAAAVKETVDLAVLRDERVLFIDQIAPSRRLRADSVVGELFPAYCTANGKALLATLSEPALEAVLPRRLPRLTEKTITSRAELLAELARVRAEGVAFDREEHTERICAVGAAIHDGLGAVAAVTVAAPAERFYGREDELADALLRATARIDAALGAPAAE